MKKLNNKGFTLVEVLAVIVILTVIGLIANPSVIESINTSKDASYDMMVKDITVAAKQLYEEIEFTGNDNLYNYNTSGIDTTNPTITLDIINSETKEIRINLQTLVSNGLLTGNNNPNKDINTNINDKIITNPKTKEDIGTCEIVITKTVDASFKTSYKIESDSTNTNCPTDTEYSKAMG